MSGEYLGGVKQDKEDLDQAIKDKIENGNPVESIVGQTLEQAQQQYHSGTVDIMVDGLVTSAVRTPAGEITLEGVGAVTNATDNDYTPEAKTASVGCVISRTVFG
ncbi:MAG: hypothetical protein AAFR98_01285 [Pseudomonadota bacterium]